MSTFFHRAYAYVASVITGEPAVIAWFLNGGAAMLAAYVFHLSGTGEAALATIVTAAVTIYTALSARPAAVPVAVGALATILTAAGAFGLHLSGQSTAMVTTVVSIVLALLFRVNLTPVATLRKARTAPR
jgi:hypothetical protein